MKTWVLAGTLAALAACASQEDRRVTRDETDATADSREVGYLELRSTHRMFRDAKETRPGGHPLFEIFNERGQRVQTGTSWSDEGASLTLAPGRYRLTTADDLDDDDRDELWITISPNGRTIVDLDKMEERTEAVVE